MTYSYGAQKRVIILRTGGSPPVISEEDKAADNLIYPGHLVGYDTDGNLIKHDGEGEKTRAAFALERDELGRDIDYPYAADDQVKVASFHAGHHVLAILASGENVAKGDPLESDGAGRLQASGSGEILAVAAEDLDNSDGSGETIPVAGDARIRVEIV